jgi:hypothetical protein
LIRSGLCGCYHAHQLGKPVLMDGPALCERNGLVTVRLGTEKCSDLIKDAAEIRSGAEGFEPACGPVALLDAPMILLEVIIQVAVRPMRHPISKDVPNGAWIGIMAIGGDAVWDHAGHRPGGAEERLGRCEIPGVTEANIHEVAISINRSVEVGL